MNFYHVIYKISYVCVIFRIYDISGSSDEKSDDSDEESDEDDNKITKAAFGI